MKKLVAVTITVLTFFLFVAAAPILPTTDYYVNDAASILADEHRENMLLVSRNLVEQQGFQLVVLTVASLDEYGYDNIDRFAADVFGSWEIGGRQEENGILIVAVKNLSECTVRVGASYTDEISAAQVQAAMEEVTPTMRKGNASKAVMDIYSALVIRLYDIWGLEVPVVETASAGSNPPYAILVIFLVIVLVTGRTFRLSNRYRKKYGKGYNRPRRLFFREAQDDGMREIEPMPDYFEKVGRQATDDTATNADSLD